MEQGEAGGGNPKKSLCLPLCTNSTVSQHFAEKVYKGGNFYLLATGWKWKIQKSTEENDKSAVEVILINVVIFLVRSNV